jgi:glycosyltransferase involved in cell wall biosynthesis
MEKLVITTNIGGACETIQDGANGFHVNPNDSVELAQKIEHCLSLIGTKQADTMTMNARKTASEKFSLDKMLQNVLSIYNEVD